MSTATKTRTFYLLFNPAAPLNNLYATDDVGYAADKVQLGWQMIETFEDSSWESAERYAIKRSDERRRRIKPETKKGLAEALAESQQRHHERDIAIQELELYLMSPKFRCGDALDGYVSIQDVLNRLAAAK